MINGIRYAKYYTDDELDGKIIKINEGFTSITGYTWEDVQDREMTIFNLIPEHQAAEYAEIVHEAQQQGEAYLSHEILCKDGTVIDVNCYGEAYKDEETGHYCSKILIVDVTEQKKAVNELDKKEAQLAAQIEKIKLLTEDAQEIFVDYDIQQDYFEISRFINGQYEIFMSKENYFNSDDRTLHNDDFDKVCEAFLVYKDKKEKQIVDFRSKLFLGRYNWYRLVYTNYVNPKTGKSHIIGRVMDINDEKMASLMLEYESGNDTLTGIYSRLTTENRVNEILSNDRKKDGHTMLIVEIDCLTDINNEWGYMEGDKILKKVAGILNDMFRQNFDILGRTEGDVFMVFIRNTSDIFYIESQCKELIRRIQSECIIENGNIDVSASIGIALCDEKCDNFKKLYKKAEKALQRQRIRGKGGYSF